MSYKVRKTLGPPSRPDLQGPCVIEDEHGNIIATMNGLGSDEQYQLACKIVNGDGSMLKRVAEALEELDDMFDPTSRVGEIINKALQEYRDHVGQQ